MHAATLTEPIADLWRAARARYESMRVALGAPEAIARQRDIEAAALAAMRAWLRPIEALVRKLILIEAAALARQPEPPRPPARPLPPLRHYAPQPQTPYPEPHEHKGRFHLWPRQKPHPARIRQLGPPLLVRDIYRERRRAAQARQLNMVRFMRPSEPVRIARRIEALARTLIMMLISRAKLVSDGATAWDEQLDCRVEHRKRHPALWALVIVVVLSLNFGIAILARLADRL